MDKTFNNTTFSNFLTLQRGFDLPKQDRESGAFPVVASTSIQAYHSEYKVKPPGVVTGRSGSLGSVQYIEVPFWPLNTTLWVKDFKGNDPKFVFYFLQTLGLERYNSGAGVPTLNRNHLDSLDIAIPILSTQRKIAAILSAYDDLIENNLRRIKILEEMAQNLYREWFVKLRFPSHQNVRFVDSSLGKIPEEWELTSLGELAEVLTKGTTPTTFGKEFKTEGINFFKVESIDQEGGIEESKLAKIDSDTHELLKRSQLQTGDILFSIAGAIGRTTIVPKRVLPANTNQALAIIRIPDENNRIYIFHCVRADEFQHFSLGRVVQTAQANVSLGILKSAPIIMPPKGLLGEFASVASSLIQMQENIRSRNIVLRRTCDLLLPRLISGELDVSELDISISEEDNKA